MTSLAGSPVPVLNAGRGGRPALDRELVGLLRTMSRANVTWGAPRIRNELAKLGIEVAVSRVARYMVKRRKPSSPSWRAFLDNHVKDLVAIDFFRAELGRVIELPDVGGLHHPYERAAA